MLARPATGETIFLIAAASGLIALSSASGPSSTAPVIWPRSAILHSAAAPIVEGTFAVTVSMALENRYPHLGPAHRAREIDGVLDDVDLGVEIGRDVDRGVRNYERVLVGRRVHDEAAADPALGTDAAFARDNRSHGSSAWRLPFITASTWP